MKTDSLLDVAMAEETARFDRRKTLRISKPPVQLASNHERSVISQEMLTALRETEFAHWQTTGGDFLSSSYQTSRAKRKIGGWGSTRLWLLALAGVSVALLTGCSGSYAESPAAPVPPPEVPVQRVVEKAIPLRFEFTGHTIAAHQVDARARVGGYVINASFGEGDFIKAGTLLFEIDPRPFTAIHAKAEAEVALAKAAADLARQELARAERLGQTDAIAVEELERKRTALETSGAALSAAIAQREAAALDVEFTKVKAPVDGRIGRALVKPGNLVSGGDANGTLLTTLVTVSPMHVLFNLDEPAYQQLTALRATGKTLAAELKFGQSDEVWAGHIDYLAPTLDARSGTAQARVVVSNADGRLSPGLFARVSVLAETERARVIVPESAIGAFQGSRFVLVVDEHNKLVHRQVSLGERRGAERLVLAGLAAGESIVVNGLQRVRPGMTVQPVQAPLARN